MAPPENPVKFPGVTPPGNEVDDNVVLTLFPSDYDRNDESGDEDEDTSTPTQQHQSIINPEAMPPMVINVYNLCLRKQTD